jgi:hypothetical protein
MNALETEWLYKPSEWQQEFHALTDWEAFGGGSAGPGKTECLLMDAVEQIVSEHDRAFNPSSASPINPGSSKGYALQMRRTYPMIEQTILRSKQIFPLLDPGATFSEEKSTWVFSSGYRYKFGHCKNAGDWKDYYSKEYTWIGFDELIQFEEIQYVQISSRLRTTDPILGAMLKLRSMSNPLTEEDGTFTVSDPHWVRRRFIDPSPDGRKRFRRRFKLSSGKEIERTWIFLPARLGDHPDPNFRDQYEATLMNMPRRLRLALLNGDWYVTAGSYYGEDWDTAIHICKPFKIPPSWRRFRTMDWGYKSHGCIHWWAIDEDDNAWIEKELTFKGKTDSQVARMVRSIELQLGLWKGNRSLITGPADTQLWEERGTAAKSKAAVFAGAGVRWVKADKRSRGRNAELLLGRLRDHGDGTKTPGIVFFNTCVNAIKTIPSIACDPQYNNEVPKDGGPDHWHDSILYGCAYASNGTAGTTMTTSYDRTRFDEDDSLEDRGVSGYGC